MTEALVITEAEAMEWVVQQAQAREAAVIEQRDNLLSKPASEEWTVDHGTTQTILRRISPQPRVISSSATKVPTATELTPEPVSQFFSDSEKPHQILALDVMVFDEVVSEVIWREGDEPVRIVTNFDGNYLRGLGTVETPSRTLDIWSFVENVSSTFELETVAAAHALGETYTPRTAPSDLAELPRGPIAYQILTEGEISDETLAEINAVFEHFSKNETEICAAVDRDNTINAAYQAYREANPPQPQDTVINFWKVR